MDSAWAMLSLNKAGELASVFAEASDALAYAQTVVNQTTLAEKTLTDLQHQITSAVTKLANVQEEAQATHDRLSLELTHAHDSAQQTKDLLVQDVALAKENALRELKVAKESAQETMTALHGQIDQLTAQRDDLQGTVDNLKSALAQMKSAVQAIQ